MNKIYNSKIGLCSIIFVILLIVLSGCGTSYGKLSADEKDIIDKVFDKQSVWASEDCSTVDFVYYEGNKALCVEEVNWDASNPANDTYTFNYYYYTFDIKKIGEDRKTNVYFTLNGKKYNYNSAWHHLKTDEDKKEYLAEKYIDAFK